jgi:nitrite reductase (NO-forming)
MHRLVGPFVLSLALGALVACTGTASPAAAPAAAGANPGAQSITIQATDGLKFEPSSITVKAGQPVQLTLSNAGQMQHDWSLNQGAAQPVKIVANAGQTATGTFTIQRAGTYTFICSVPGHAAAGMQGTITAQ